MRGGSALPFRLPPPGDRGKSLQSAGRVARGQLVQDPVAERTHLHHARLERARRTAPRVDRRRLIERSLVSLSDMLCLRGVFSSGSSADTVQIT